MVGTFASLVLGLVAVLWIALRLNKVANPISLRSDIDDLVAMKEITPQESRVVREVYRRTYELNNADSLFAYELRGLRLQRIWRWVGDSTLAQVCTDRAAEIRTDVDITLARASTTLVRRRGIPGACRWLGARTLRSLCRRCGGFCDLQRRAQQPPDRHDRNRQELWRRSDVPQRGRDRNYDNRVGRDHRHRHSHDNRCHAVPRERPTRSATDLQAVERG